MANKNTTTNWIIIVIAVIILIFIAVIYKGGRQQIPDGEITDEYLQKLSLPDDPNFRADPDVINKLTAP